MNLWTKSYDVTTQMKPLCLYFLMVLFVCQNFRKWNLVEICLWPHLALKGLMGPWFLELYSGFQSPGFRILRAKILPDFGFHKRIFPGFRISWHWAIQRPFFTTSFPGFSPTRPWENLGTRFIGITFSTDKNLSLIVRRYSSKEESR